MTRHRTAFRQLLLWGWALATALAIAPCARAYEEQGSIDLAAGATLVSGTGPLSTYGASIDIGASLGISDMFVVRAAGGYAAADASDKLRSLGRIRAEIAYLIDVVRWVPFFGIGASGWLYKVDQIQFSPGGHVVLGLDFLFNRTWTIGLDLRTGMLLMPGNTLQSQSEVQLRISRMFDRF